MLNSAFDFVSLKNHTRKFHFRFLQRLPRAPFPECEQLTADSCPDEAGVSSQLLEAPAWPTRVQPALTGPTSAGPKSSDSKSPRLPTTAVSMAEVPANPGDTGTYFLPRTHGSAWVGLNFSSSSFSWFR